MYIPKYTLLPYKEAVIDNVIQNEIICIGRNDLLVIVKTSHAIMNVHTLLPFVECTIMTVVITLLCIIYIAIV